MHLSRRSLLIGSVSAGTAAIALAQAPGAPFRDLFRQAERTTPAGRTVDVRSFGARGDESGDDTSAIQAAVDMVARSGGGIVRIPAGTYIASRGGPSAVAIALRSGVVLEGDGTASILRLQDGSGGHLINVARETNCGVRNLVLDGNRARQVSTGHGFRAGGVSGLRLENVVVRNAFHYGIGFEAGANRDVLIRNVLVEDCGGDGIDIKNRGNSDGLITIDNVTVRRWGLRSERQTQAAIDCRGSVRLSNIRVSEPAAADAVGVRMRHGEVGDPNGAGAHGSQFTGFDIRMGGGERQTGLAVAARDVSVANGSVFGGRRGLLIQDSGFRGSSIGVSNCSDVGIVADVTRKTLMADSTVLSRCRASNCGRNGIEIEADGVELIECVSVGNGAFGLLIKQTASGTRVVGGDYSGNRLARIADRGTNSRVAVSAS